MIRSNYSLFVVFDSYSSLLCSALLLSSLLYSLDVSAIMPVHTRHNMRPVSLSETKTDISHLPSSTLSTVSSTCIPSSVTAVNLPPLHLAEPAFCSRPTKRKHTSIEAESSLVVPFDTLMEKYAPVATQNENAECEKVVTDKRKKAQQTIYNDLDRRDIHHWFYMEDKNIEEVNRLLKPRGIQTNLNYIRQLHFYFNKHGCTEMRSKPGRKAWKVTEEVIGKIKQMQDQKADCTLKQLQHDLQEELKVDLSESTILKTLFKLGFTTKVLRTIPLQRNSPELIEQRKEYAARALEFDPKHCLYIDEMPLSCHIHRTLGRSVKGSPAAIKQRGSKSRNTTVIAAISPHYGLVHFNYHLGGTDGDRFKNFMLELMSKEPVKSGSFLFLMDNSPVHSSGVVKDCFTGTKRKQTQMFIPPYSPSLNAIEFAFSVWSNKIKQTYTNDQVSLGEAIEKGSELVTDTKCESFQREVTHCLTHYCIQGKPLPDRDPVPHIDAQPDKQNDLANKS